MKKEFLKVEVSEEEYDLLIAIRNYKRAYPNGQRELLHYARSLFVELLEADLD